MIDMKHFPWLKMLPVVLAGMILSSGCVYRERTVYREHGRHIVTTETAGAEVVVAEAPPAPMVETVTISPGPGFLWIGGNWVWRGHWYWERGHWLRPPHPGAVWVPHHYFFRDGHHVFIRGGWR